MVKNNNNIAKYYYYYSRRYIYTYINMNNKEGFNEEKILLFKS